MYQTMQQQCGDLTSNPNYDEQYALFRRRQMEIKGVIQDKFKEWRK